MPAEQRPLYAEQVIDLPCILCYEPPEYLPEVSALPALGSDSFTFGWGVTDGATWPDLLETALGRCVYNLGVNGASPAQEEMLLDDLFSRDTALAPRRVLWALYEGNDLEDSYADELPAAVVRSPAASLPDPGSVSAQHPIHSPDVSFGIQRRRCASLPARKRCPAASELCAATPRASPDSTAASSSMMWM